MNMVPLNIEKHPCFMPESRHTFGRVHLPVAPRCNIQCNFCNRRFDCVNESRPGVTSGILSPDQALAYLKSLDPYKNNLAVVGIAGPGDPFANPQETLTVFEQVRQTYPDLLLCVATNGLNVLPYLDDLERLAVTHVSITVNAVDPKIGARIYAWIRHGKKTLPPEQGAEILLANQLEAIEGLKQRGIIVKINSIVLPGINETHIADIAAAMATYDVDIFNCMPYYPNQGANFSHLAEPSPKSIAEIRLKAGKYIPQMHHCTRCRADAVGRLQDPHNEEAVKCLSAFTSSSPQKNDAPLKAKKPYVAVASREGVLINQHLGEAGWLFIYGYEHGHIKIIDRRKTPQKGTKDNRWIEMANLLGDCQALLTNGIGDRPKTMLTARGIQVHTIEGVIDNAVQTLFNGGNLAHLKPGRQSGCGISCSGTGAGCA